VTQKVIQKVLTPIFFVPPQHSSLALATLEKAIQKDPQNPLCKFHKASILFSSERHHEALKELEELKELVPRESLVYFLMGKVGSTSRWMVFRTSGLTVRNFPCQTLKFSKVSLVMGS
jgi:tetratricopeptide (TPR) repeat protein